MMVFEVEKIVKSYLGNSEPEVIKDLTQSIEHQTELTVFALIREEVEKYIAVQKSQYQLK